MPDQADRLRFAMQEDRAQIGAADPEPGLARAQFSPLRCGLCGLQGSKQWLDYHDCPLGRWAEFLQGENK